MEVFVPQCVSTPEFIHAAMRPDVITETVVEVSTEESEPMDTSPIPASPEIHEPMKKKKGTGKKCVVGKSNKTIKITKNGLLKAQHTARKMA